MPLIHSGAGWTPANTSAVGTGANTTETNLQTLVIDAALLTSGDLVRIIASGTWTGTANIHISRLYFGATAISLLSQTPGSSPVGFNHSALVVVTGAATQKCGCLGLTSTGVIDSANTAPAETISGTITVKTTGQTLSAADEITSELLVVEIIPA